MVAALELLSGLTDERLGAHVEPLIVPSKVMELLYRSTQDLVPEVRQHSFAVIGNLTRACFRQVYPSLIRKHFTIIIFFLKITLSAYILCGINFYF